VHALPATGAAVEATLDGFRGEIEQVPPMYSAKKVGGKKLYELARRGERVERAAVRIRVSAFELLAGEGGEEGGAVGRRNEDGTCDVRARVVCSAGTYVRALAESFGAGLGVGAHLAALRRTRAGSFDLSGAVTVEELRRLSEGGRAGEALIPLEAALPELPSVHLNAEGSRRVRHGAAITATAVAASAARPAVWDDGERVRLFDDAGRLAAVAVYDAGRALLRPRVMLAAAEGADEK